MILIAYDGSQDSEAVIDHIARLTPGTHVSVLTVWQPYIQMITDASVGMGMGWGGSVPVDTTATDKASADAALFTARAGADRAREAGLSAEPSVRVRETSVAEAILAAADELAAEAIAMGTRGRTGLRSMILGSVSHAVLQHADRAVIVVPSEAVAEDRRAHGRHASAQSPTPSAPAPV